MKKLIFISVLLIANVVNAQSLFYSTPKHFTDSVYGVILCGKNMTDTSKQDRSIWDYTVFQQMGYRVVEYDYTSPQNFNKVYYLDRRKKPLIGIIVWDFKTL